MDRRSFLKSTGGILVFPSIVNSENLMPVKKLITPPTDIMVIDEGELNQWSNKTPEQILADIDDLFTGVFETTPIES